MKTTGYPICGAGSFFITTILGFFLSLHPNNKE